MWNVKYHPEVKLDLEALGKHEARRVLRAINQRILLGEPDKIGKPLRGSLKGCRRIRVGNTRIVYRVTKTTIEILILAAGLRRDNLVYTYDSSRYGQEKSNERPQRTVAYVRTASKILTNPDLEVAWVYQSATVRV